MQENSLGNIFLLNKTLNAWNESAPEKPLIALAYDNPQTVKKFFMIDNAAVRLELCPIKNARMEAAFV